MNSVQQSRTQTPVQVIQVLVNYHAFECDQVNISASFNPELGDHTFLEPPSGQSTPSPTSNHSTVSSSSTRLLTTGYDHRDSHRHEPTPVSTNEYATARLPYSSHIDGRLIASNLRKDLDVFRKQFNARFSRPYLLGSDHLQRRLDITRRHEEYRTLG